MPSIHAQTRDVKNPEAMPVLGTAPPKVWSPTRCPAAKLIPVFDSYDLGKSLAASAWIRYVGKSGPKI